MSEATATSPGATRAVPRSAPEPRRSYVRPLALAILLLVLLVVGFAIRPDWPSRLAFLVVAVLAYPVLRVLLFKRV